jgi:hypothetical protein
LQDLDALLTRTPGIHLALGWPCKGRYEGAILEAGAIVLKDMKPWMIVIENTARD